MTTAHTTPSARGSAGTRESRRQRSPTSTRPRPTPKPIWRHRSSKRCTARACWACGCRGRSAAAPSWIRCRRCACSRSVVRRPLDRLGADGRGAGDRHRRGLPGRRRRRGAVRRRTPAGDRRTGHAPGNGHAAGRRLPADRILELRVRHQARHAHPHARRHRGHGRAAHLRAAGREGHAHRQLGRAGAARHRQHRLPHRSTCSCPRPTPTRRRCRRRSAAGRSSTSPSSDSRCCAIRLGVRHRPAPARRAGGEGAGGRRAHRHAGHERGLPRAVRQGRGHLPRGARARLRDVGRA